MKEKLCDYGCGQPAIHPFKNGKWCCSKNAMQCPVKREERKRLTAGSNNPMYGKKHKRESIKKMQKPHYGVRGDNHPNRQPGMKEILRKRFNPEYVRSFIDHDIRIANSIIANKDPVKRKKQSIMMKNGMSKYISSFITYTKPPWNKGKPNCFSEKTLNKIAKSCRISVIKRIEERLKDGHQLCPNFNPDACTLIDEYGNEHGYNFQHAENGEEYYIKELGYWVDGYDSEKNTVVEVNEPFHYNVQGNLLERDVRRQNEIIDFLGCDFIRMKVDKDNNIVEVARLNY